MNFRSLTRFWPVILILMGSAQAYTQAVPGRYPLTTATVSVVLQSAGLIASPTQIELPLQLTAESASPTLHVVTAEMMNSNRLRVRLACESSRDCLPFFALVDLSTQNPNLRLLASLNSSSMPNPPTRGVETTTLRAGQHATLLMQDEHMRISVPVISIDSGGIGKDVRVSSLDRKITYQATVVNAQVVQGSLP